MKFKLINAPLSFGEPDRFYKIEEVARLTGHSVEEIQFHYDKNTGDGIPTQISGNGYTFLAVHEEIQFHFFQRPSPSASQGGNEIQIDPKIEQKRQEMNQFLEDLASTTPFLGNTIPFL